MKCVLLAVAQSWSRLIVHEASFWERVRLEEQDEDDDEEYWNKPKGAMPAPNYNALVIRFVIMQEIRGHNNFLSPTNNYVDTHLSGFLKVSVMHLSVVFKVWVGPDLTFQPQVDMAQSPPA